MLACIQVLAGAQENGVQDLSKANQQCGRCRVSTWKIQEWGKRSLMLVYFNLKLPSKYVTKANIDQRCIMKGIEIEWKMLHHINPLKHRNVDVGCCVTSMHLLGLV